MSRCCVLSERRCRLKPRKPEQAAPRKALIREPLFCQLLSASGPPMQQPRVDSRLRCRLILCRSGEAPPLKALARRSASELLMPRLALLKMDEEGLSLLPFSREFPDAIPEHFRQSSPKN
jgi:hypothetical protein